MLHHTHTCSLRFALPPQIEFDRTALVQHLLSDCHEVSSLSWCSALPQHKLIMNRITLNSSSQLSSCYINYTVYSWIIVTTSVPDHDICWYTSDHCDIRLNSLNTTVYAADIITLDCEQLLFTRHVDAFCLATYKNMPVCHVCTPEEDHIGRNIVFIKDFAPRPLQQVQATTSNVLNCLNNIAVIQTLLKVF